MADYDGYEGFAQIDTFVQLSAEAVSSNTPATDATATPMLLTDYDYGELNLTDPGFAPVVADFDGYKDFDQLGDYFFERDWFIPGRIELGNIVSTVTRDIEAYNSYRDASRSLTAATPNAGPGVTLENLPGLPYELTQQSGLVFQVKVLAEGPPEIDGTLDFTVSGGSQSIIITGTRVIIFVYEPEIPVSEVLEFKTDIFTAANGKEQRVNVRKKPRQLITYNYRLDENTTDRRKFRNILFGAQAATWGIPIWFEKRTLGADIAVDDTTITVNTEYADFRVGGLAVVYSDTETFDALEIQSMTTSSLTFTSGATFAHTAGEALVMPLRTAKGGETARGRRYLRNVDDISLSFVTTDNDSDIASTAAFNTYDGKVLLDDGNWVGGTSIDDDTTTEVIVIDNGISAKYQTTDWLAPLLPTTKGFVTTTRQAIWEARQLVHALRGSQVSFYMPTFFDEMIPVQDLASGSFDLDIENVGFNEFVGAQPPFGHLWILKTDGTTLERAITNAAELTSTTERITVDVAWPSTITPAEIDRISILRLSRIAGDRVNFQHYQLGRAAVTMGVVGVQR